MGSYIKASQIEPKPKGGQRGLNSNAEQSTVNPLHSTPLRSNPVSTSSLTSGILYSIIDHLTPPFLELYHTTAVDMLFSHIHLHYTYGSKVTHPQATKTLTNGPSSRS